MDDKQLEKIAEIHFATLRTRCSFIHLNLPPRVEDEYYVFSAMFKCKKTCTTKTVFILKNGTIIGQFVLFCRILLECCADF